MMYSPRPLTGYDIQAALDAERPSIGYGSWLSRTLRDVGRAITGPVGALVGGAICAALTLGACAVVAGATAALTSAQAIAEALSNGGRTRTGSTSDPRAYNDAHVLVQGNWALARYPNNQWFAWPVGMSMDDALEHDRVWFWAPGMRTWTRAADLTAIYAQQFGVAA